MARMGSGIGPLLITGRHLAEVLPLVDAELAEWRRLAEAIPDPALREHAIGSLVHKRFHCEGGSVFATWASRAKATLVRFIVAFQTISDYLDNLCDRTESLDPDDFRQLHRSMFDAVSPAHPAQGAYYRHHPNSDDGGYLASLVAACREALTQVPGFPDVEERVRRHLSLYVDLQILKHIAHERRVPELVKWFEAHAREHPSLRWWEFAAATGSTLAIFALVADASRRAPLEAPGRLDQAYFPWIGGLHILLDYLIDQEEDRREGDLNFVSFYSGSDELEARMNWILQEALRAAGTLRDRSFHVTVIEGLLGLYLSDPKVERHGLEKTAAALLRQAGWRARIVHAYCRRWRRRGRRTRPEVPSG